MSERDEKRITAIPDYFLRDVYTLSQSTCLFIESPRRLGTENEYMNRLMFMAISCILDKKNHGKKWTINNLVYQIRRQEPVWPKEFAREAVAQAVYILTEKGILGDFSGRWLFLGRQVGNRTKLVLREGRIIRREAGQLGLGFAQNAHVPAGELELLKKSIEEPTD